MNKEWIADDLWRDAMQFERYNPRMTVNILRRIVSLFPDTWAVIPVVDDIIRIAEDYRWWDDAIAAAKLAQWLPHSPDRDGYAFTVKRLQLLKAGRRVEALVLAMEYNSVESMWYCRIYAAEFAKLGEYDRARELYARAELLARSNEQQHMNTFVGGEQPIRTRA